MASSRSKYYNVTVRDINLKIPKDATDDIEFLELLGKMQDGDIFALPKAARILFGDQYEDVIKALADKNGKTKASDATEFFTEVMRACNALAAKN